MSRTRLLLVLARLLLLYPVLTRHRYVTKKPYDVDEAYKVYSAILPSIGERPLVIGAETRTPEICLQPLDAQSEKVLRPAIDNYLELNALPWQLQKHFDINRHYELLAEEELKVQGRNERKLIDGRLEDILRAPPRFRGIDRAVGDRIQLRQNYRGSVHWLSLWGGVQRGRVQSTRKQGWKTAITNRKRTVEPLRLVYS
jgi:hypothetical protein